VLAAALVGFLFFSGATSGQGGSLTADRGAAVVTGVATVVAIAACLYLAHQTVPPTGRAALLGVAVGTVYALMAALIKAASDVLAAHGVLAVVTSWKLYAVLLLGAAGQYLTQLAFQAGPITSSLPAISTVDPLLSVVIGVLVYHEALHRGPLGGLVLLVLLLVLVTAVIQLGRVETEESASADQADGTMSMPTRPRSQNPAPATSGQRPRRGHARLASAPPVAG
jgi:hypothetical protein